MNGLGAAALFVLLCWWVRDAVREFPENLRELRDPQEPWQTKFVIVVIWLLTLAFIPPIVSRAVAVVTWIL